MTPSGAWAAPLRGSRGADLEFRAFLRDEYRGRMRPETFLSLSVRDRRQPSSWLRDAVGRLVGAGRAWWRSASRGLAERSPRPVLETVVLRDAVFTPGRTADAPPGVRPLHVEFAVTPPVPSYDALHSQSLGLSGGMAGSDRGSP